MAKRSKSPNVWMTDCCRAALYRRRPNYTLGRYDPKCAKKAGINTYAERVNVFREIKRTPTPRSDVKASQLKNGTLFIFQNEVHQGDQVYMKVQRPDSCKASDHKVYVVSMACGKVIGIEDCAVHLVEAKMEWHVKPWSAQA